MRFGSFVLMSSLLLASASPTIAAMHTRRGPTSPRLFGKRSARSRSQGQRTIDDERATQIQSALIRSGYLSGQPSGHWDTATQGAMERLQADNGWQTKLVPDSRAIIKLGLGSSTVSYDSHVNQPTTPHTAN